MWSLVGKKEKCLRPGDDPEQAGSQWLYLAMDTDTKLIISHFTGKRDGTNAVRFLEDLGERVLGEPLISSDGWHGYKGVVRGVFGDRAKYGRLVKAGHRLEEAKALGVPLSTMGLVAIERDCEIGEFDPDDICTSHVERLNASFRNFNRRAARKTLAFAKTFESLQATVALFAVWYNFCWIHRSLKTSPAVAAGLLTRPWTMEDLVEDILERE